MNNHFLPVNKNELAARGWKNCDIIIISGDAYIDHPAFGAPLIARYLESLGYRVGLIAQPDWNSNEDFLKLGIPELFVGITAGNIDSMLAHYTANKKLRSNDAYTPGNTHGKRPDRATIVYTNKIRQLMPGIPIVIGGLEASMRRLSHYDYWSDKLRRSILLDSKADILAYGMAEKALEEIALRIKSKLPLDNIRGTVITKGEKGFHPTEFPEAVNLPTFEELKANKDIFLDMTRQIEQNLNPFNASTLIQKSGTQYVIVNPPAFSLSTEELDYLYKLPFTRLPHPSYKDKIPAYEMIKDSITILRGCPGACTFCSIGLHQGKFIQSRSQSSIINEIKALIHTDSFKGVLSDLGGPSANLYQMGCKNKKALLSCTRPSCLYPEVCTNFNTNHTALISLMKNTRKLTGIKKIHISSGLRHDVAIKSTEYIKELACFHTPGHLKLAPEHFEESVLKRMRKPHRRVYEEFSDHFNKISRKEGKKQYILPYLITSFPGCTQKDMATVAHYLKKNQIKVEQVQDFIPLPMTIATAMYYTEKDYFNNEKIFVAKKHNERKAQKSKIFWNKEERKPRC
jgi:uncharacterized radical SAM protein YgiQ